ncbi:RLA class II histocompatibility antigen, DP alpha-1 chain-like [Cololabis saira]|uniref:RLA class II histocompatibility antigen, DP alpha-1 chain-like n=1 Tax=Cololabis saira TaxID=129043 RepID=UPI002AD5155F|nr:RLA class II histocompatibility antigen, DP alpha-1 chain-like [Cololabis saira]
MTRCSELKCSAVIILTFNIFCTVSQNAQVLDYFVGCFENGTVEVQLELNSQEIFYVDFDKETVEYTGPPFSKFDPSLIFNHLHLYSNAKRNKNACLAAAPLVAIETGHPPEERDPPESVLYTAEEAELGVKNSLICFANNFYPPLIKINWTKNGNPVTEGVSLSRYYPNEDHTFHQFSTLMFTPSETDFYKCIVEHSALKMPETKIWEPKFSPQTPEALGLDVFCGLGLTVGVLGVAAGTLLIVRALP